jgi:isopentenyldiphosphate isomerase
MCKKVKNLLKDNEYIICVHCFIINSKKEILLTQRSMKMNRGGKWEDTHGGLKSGETSVDGIIRELKEELGIEIKQEDLKLYKTLKKDNVFRDIYVIYKDISLDLIRFNDCEVMNCKYVTVHEFKDMIEKGECSFKNFKDTIFYNSDVLEF